VKKLLNGGVGSDSMEKGRKEAILEEPVANLADFHHESQFPSANV
jgi:hypothetical protein